MKCIQCFDTAVRDPDYKPPGGFDPRTQRYICTNKLCQCVLYIIRKDPDKPLTELTELK